MELDVNSDAATISAKIAAAIELFGGLDVIVNNAGYTLLGAMEDISDEEAHAQMETNFFGPMRVIRAALPTLRAQESGTIVNISSGATLFNRPSLSLYAASKLALEGMSESLSRELLPFNIRVITIQPGAFGTNFLNAAVFATQPPVDPITHVSPAYETGAVRETMDYLPKLNENWKPDPVSGKPPTMGGSVEKAVMRIFEVVAGTGMARELVVGEGFRLPLGKDCVGRWDEKIENMKGDLERVRGVALSTEY